MEYIHSNLRLGEMHDIVGQACMVLIAIHLPLMTFTCKNNYKYNTRTILSVQATVQLHEQVNGLRICTGSYIMKAKQ